MPALTVQDLQAYLHSIKEMERFLRKRQREILQELARLKREEREK